MRLKTSGFRTLTRQRRLAKPAHLSREFFDAAKQLLRQFDHPGPFRLVGMAAFDLTRQQSPWQLDLFEDAPRHRLETTIDALGERFGRGIVMPARDLRHPGTIAEGVNLDFMDAVAADG